MSCVIVEPNVHDDRQCDQLGGDAGPVRCLLPPNVSSAGGALCGTGPRSHDPNTRQPPSFRSRPGRILDSHRVFVFSRLSASRHVPLTGHSVSPARLGQVGQKCLPCVWSFSKSPISRTKRRSRCQGSCAVHGCGDSSSLCPLMAQCVGGRGQGEDEQTFTFAANDELELKRKQEGPPYVATAQSLVSR